MKLIGKSGCIVTGVALVGITHLLQSSQWCQVFVSGWAWPHLALSVVTHLISSHRDIVLLVILAANVSLASHPAGGLVHLYLKWVESLTVMELVTVFKSSCGPDLHWEETSERKGENLDTRPRDSPHRGQCSEFHDGKISQKPSPSQYDIAYCWLHGTGDWKTSKHREKNWLPHCIIRVHLWVSLKVDARLMNLKLMRAQFRTQQESLFVNFIFWLGTGNTAEPTKDNAIA